MARSYDFSPLDFLQKMEEEKKLQQAMEKAEYMSRKQQKEEHRARIEAAAMKLCDTVESMEKVKSVEEIAQLAAVLNCCAMAMHAAENYAEYRPITGSVLGFGA